MSDVIGKSSSQQDHTETLHQSGSYSYVGVLFFFNLQDNFTFEDSTRHMSLVSEESNQQTRPERPYKTGLPNLEKSGSYSYVGLFWFTLHANFTFEDSSHMTLGSEELPKHQAHSEKLHQTGLPILNSGSYSYVGVISFIITYNEC